MITPSCLWKQRLAGREWRAVQWGAAVHGMGWGCCCCCFWGDHWSRHRISTVPKHSSWAPATFNPRVRSSTWAPRPLHTGCRTDCTRSSTRTAICRRVRPAPSSATSNKQHIQVLKSSIINQVQFFALKWISCLFVFILIYFKTLNIAHESNVLPNAIPIILNTIKYTA